MDHVLHEMSYANVILYGATLPSYGSKKDSGGKASGQSGQELIKADDPANRERVRRFFEEVD